VTTPLDLKNTKHKFILKVFFELPELNVILRGNLHGMEQNMVEIAFGDFIVRYDKSDPYETSIKMSLRSLVVEDLLQSEASPHRKLVVSQFVIQEDTALESIRIPLYASKSCPDFGMQLGHSLQKRNSLPDRLETSFLYGIMKPTIQTQQQMKTSPTGEYPCTPPPSPRNTASPQDVMSRKDNLVHIDVQLIDPKSPEFFSRHNANQRYVDINFNCLDLIVNIESWVMILDFFGMGTEQENIQVKKPKVQTQQLKCDESVNSELEIKIRSLTLVLTRGSGGELARANVSQFTAHTEKRGLESSTSGKLGKLSLLDLTPHGRLYRERFTTTGGEALDFQILNYSKPDVELTREFDTQVRLKMSSVHYVHTQRFIEELKTQFTHFSVLQTLVSKFRAAASGNLGEDHATRGRRIFWDIQAASPVILLPLSSKSNKVLVADLGELTVTNKFSLKIHEITSCLIDVMSIDLINMDLFSGHRITTLDSHNIDKSSVLHLGIGTYVEKIGTSFRFTNLSSCT
jgi:vacuolar protein sorting-associated protein 13D